MFPALTKALSLAVSVFTDTVQGFFCTTLQYDNLAWDLTIHARFDDLDLVSVSQVCQNHKLQIVFF